MTPCNHRLAKIVRGPFGRFCLRCGRHMDKRVGLVIGKRGLRKLAAALGLNKEGKVQS